MAKREFRQTHGGVKSLAELVSGSMDEADGSGSSSRKARRAQQVKSMYKTVIEQMFAGNPASGKILLDHTNAVYIIRESKPCSDAKVLVVYVDEGIYATELNARREVIKMKFSLMGEELSEFRILVSRGEYKRVYPYRQEAAMETGFRVCRKTLSEQEIAAVSAQAACIESSSLKEAFIKAEIECKTNIVAPVSKNLK